LQQPSQDVQQSVQLVQHLSPQQPSGQQPSVQQPSVQQPSVQQPSVQQLTPHEKACFTTGLECVAADSDAREINAENTNLYMIQIL
jgi:hypothetical protein